MGWFEISISFFTLTILEIVLGVDNLVILAILTEHLPKKQQKKARAFGLMLAWISRLLLLFTAVWLVKYTRPFFTYSNFQFSIRDLFLILGGIFLITKATQEIHQEVMQELSVHKKPLWRNNSFWVVVAQIGVIDIIFSLDSVLTAVGLTSYFYIMASAITITIILMIYASDWLCSFIAKYPTLKMLALSFLILIGMVLVADGFAFHIPRAYVYFAMGFSLTVESLNLMRLRRKKRRNIK